MLLILLAATAAPPSFTARAADGSDRAGPLVALEVTGKLTLSGAEPIPAGELLALARTDRPRPEWPTGPGLILANGDRIPGTAAGGDELSLTFRPTAVPADWRVPLATVRVWWATAPQADLPLFPADYPWLPPDQSTDLVRLRNGDTLRGTVERVTAGGGLSLKTADGKSVTLEPSAVAAVAFNPALNVVRKPKGTFARLVAADGTRLTVTGVSANDTVVRGTTPFSAKIELPTTELIALDVVGGKAVPLSELKPTVVVEPFAGLKWEPQSDRSVKGRPLTLLGPRGPETFDRGLGTHPRTTLTYPLNGQYRRFEAVVGLDAVTGRRGTAAVRVLVDGKPAESPRLNPLLPGVSVPVRADVAKAKALTLVIDFGPGGDVQADVNWADARLIR